VSNVNNFIHKWRTARLVTQTTMNDMYKEYREFGLVIVQ